MNAGRKWVPLLAAVILLCAALGWLFQLRLGGGDLYPNYSSLRADALGTRALYDALGLVPGMAVDRDYRPLAKLENALFRAIKTAAGDIGGQQIGCELNTTEDTVDAPREGFGQRRLAGSRHIFKQDMSPCQ